MQKKQVKMRKFVSPAMDVARLLLARVIIVKLCSGTDAFYYAACTCRCEKEVFVWKRVALLCDASMILLVLADR